MITPITKEPSLYHLFGLLDGSRFRLAMATSSEIFRVEHASTGDGDTPVYIHEETGGLVPAKVIFERNGGSYFVLPVPAEKGAGPC